MIDSTGIISLLEAWLATAIPALDGRTYDYAPSGKPLGLPDASIIVLEERTQLSGGDDFPYGELQQVRVHVLEFGVSFMVDAGTDDAGERAADHQLRSFAHAILAALHPQGAALGERILLAADASMDYRTPFAEYEDGTRGREATMTMTVGQLL